MRKIFLYLIRGLPGCGKTSLANQFNIDITEVCEADQYFTDKEGNYNFISTRIADAHQFCLNKARTLLEEGRFDVIVSNTFTQRWEMEPYIQLAKEFDVQLVVLDLFDGGCSDEELTDRNNHSVPLAAIQRMRERYEHDWKNGNPLPPWERSSPN